jgi:hypothetical protein
MPFVASRQVAPTPPLAEVMREIKGCARHIEMRRADLALGKGDAALVSDHSDAPGTGGQHAAQDPVHSSGACYHPGPEALRVPDSR